MCFQYSTGELIFQMTFWVFFGLFFIYIYSSGGRGRCWGLCGATWSSSFLGSDMGTYYKENVILKLHQHKSREIRRSFYCIYFFLNLLTWDWVSRSQLHHTTITDHLFISSWADAALGVEVMRLVYRVSWWTVRRSAADSRTLTASALSCFEAHRKKYPWMQRLNRETVSAVNHAWYRKGRLSGRIWWNLMATSVSIFFFPRLWTSQRKNTHDPSVYSFERVVRKMFWKICVNIRGVSSEETMRLKQRNTESNIRRWNRWFNRDFELYIGFRNTINLT